MFYDFLNEEVIFGTIACVGIEIKIGLDLVTAACVGIKVKICFDLV